ncbi:hypothetical protein CHLNCDRAFT_54573 [Chlorella variabilis]|uniref:Exostosin GT47 domain-containing protein n=1 Tax=Chlorella variabilis TaxID=554065 RepID=E1ZPI6_CHLVA|nr:hypothetical protein CHLNCDRAFT_54573 [Chlorella variabilis]EFN52330.1 hypothetical protein CHLNCDRAFT_54573 [Chlorella variabilis]|eukprot:XP_005844432.1 hypothetical protein CHLNCDRAFT_54573 [Chlorella variabilis]
MTLQASLPPPWHAVRDCKIYILDLSTDVAPALGIPQCDINDPKVRMIMCGPEAVRECLVMLFAMPAQMCISNAMELQVWPLAEPGELPWSMQHMKAMPHMHFQYAGQYWLTQALRNASGVLTDNIDEACLVWVDTYCYHQKLADVGDLAAPIVGSQRPTFLYMAASCQKGNDNCGKFMRYSAAVAFNDTAPDVQVMCTTSKDSKSYSEVQLEMRNSVFCLLPPGDYPCSNRLSEAILSGCIPVFIGPPWHEIPFHRGEVDWASMAVFLNITSEPSWLESPDCRSKQQKWYQSADVGFATVAVPDLPAAYEYLRRMPKDALQRHQAALERVIVVVLHFVEAHRHCLGLFAP